MKRERPDQCPRRTAVAACFVLLVVGVGCTHRTRIKALSATGVITQGGAVQFDLSGTVACVKQQWDGTRYVWLRDVRCPDDIARMLRAETGGTPQLAVKTPWGAVWRAPITKKGRAKLAVDWARARLSGTWLVAVQGTSLAMRWAPDDRDIAHALAAIDDAVRVLARTGVAPPALRIESFESDSNQLRAGRSAPLRLTLVNQGSGPAYGVAAVTRSELAALDNLRFEFGRISPGESATQVVDVIIPRNATDFLAMVTLDFREANRHAPDSYSKKFTLAVHQCPDGKLTDSLYTDKRAKLERALKARALTREEFEKYDTELLLCLE